MKSAFATVAVLAFVTAPHCPAAPATREHDTRDVRVLVINYDPVLTDGQRLSRRMKWNDPRPMTTNLVRYLRECSGGYARYQIVEFVDVNAFPQKRDGFRYTEATFLEMWKDRKKAHKPDSVSYA